MEDKKIPELLAELGRLQVVRGKLMARSFAEKGEQLVEAALSSVDDKIAKVGARFAKANERSEDRKKERAEYEAALKAIEAEYGREVQAIAATIKGYENLKNKALAIAAIAEQTLGKTTRRHRREKVKTNLRETIDNVKGAFNFREDVDSAAQKAIDDSNERMQDEANERQSLEEARAKCQQTKSITKGTVDRCDENIRIQQEKFARAKAKRDKELMDLTEDRALVEQSPMSRVLGFFGVGAAKRVQVIQDGMKDRTAKAIDRQKGLNQEVNQNIESIESVNGQIRDEIHDRINAAKEMGKATVETCIDYIAQKQQRGKEMLEEAKSRVSGAIDFVGTSVKGGLQKGVSVALASLNEFSQGYDSTMEAREAARDKMVGNKAEPDISDESR